MIQLRLLFIKKPTLQIIQRVGSKGSHIIHDNKSVSHGKHKSPLK